ncbi:MAG: DoxX family protein [Candidatus Kapaibacterium sp.]
MNGTEQKGLHTGLLLLRIGLGIMMVIHGSLKFAGGEEALTWTGSAVSIFGFSSGHMFFGIIAAMIEIIGGLLLALGFFHKLAALALLLVMIMASIYEINANTGFSDTFVKASHPVKIGIVYLSLIISGPGKYSLDNRIFNKKQKKTK